MYRYFIFCAVLFLFCGKICSQQDTLSLTHDQNPNYLKSKNKYLPTKQTNTTALVSTIHTVPITSVTISKSVLPTTELLQQKIEELNSQKQKTIFQTQSISNLSNQFKNKGDYKKALELQLLLKKVTDSLHTIELNSIEAQDKLKLQNLQQSLQHNLEQEKNKAVFQDRILTKEKEIKKTKLVTYFIGGLCLVSLILAFFLYRSFKNTRLQKIMIEKSLYEKNILLKEIHHRVKNNLQIVTSLLNLQLKGTNSQEAKQIMEEAKNRINSISLIHQSIYQSTDLTSVDIQKYIEELFQIIHTMFNINKKNIICNVNTHQIHLNIDTAVPLGLIINELLTNCYKYAFTNKNDGVITIELKKQIDTKYELSFNDNGIGLPENFELKNQKSLGTTLIKGLTQQLKGEVIVENKNGTYYTISFNELVA